jgi:hypothetical protein
VSSGAPLLTACSTCHNPENPQLGMSVKSMLGGVAGRCAAPTHEPAGTTAGRFPADVHQNGHSSLPSASRNSVIWPGGVRSSSRTEARSPNPRCHSRHNDPAYLSISIAPALMRGINSRPNSVVSATGSKPRMRKDEMPRR